MTKKQLFALASTAAEAKEGIILRCLGIVVVVPLVSGISISLYPPDSFLVLKILTPIALAAVFVYGLILEYKNYQELKSNENTSKSSADLQISLENFARLAKNKKEK